MNGWVFIGSWSWISCFWLILSWIAAFWSKSCAIFFRLNPNALVLVLVTESSCAKLLCLAVLFLDEVSRKSPALELNWLSSCGPFAWSRSFWPLKFLGHHCRLNSYCRFLCLTQLAQHWSLCLVWTSWEVSQSGSLCLCQPETSDWSQIFPWPGSETCSWVWRDPSYAVGSTMYSCLFGCSRLSVQ